MENRFRSSPDETFKAFAQAMAGNFNETVPEEHPRMLNRVHVENDGGYNDSRGIIVENICAFLIRQIRYLSSSPYPIR